MVVNKSLFKSVTEKLSIAFTNRNKIDKSINIYYFPQYELFFMNLGKMILAKGISDKTNGNVMSVSSDRTYENDTLSELFGFEKMHINSSVRFYERILAKIYTFFVSVFADSPKKILNIKYKRIFIGDLIYNTIIRFSNMSTLNKIETKHSKIIVENAFRTAMVYDRWYKKNPPTYYILSELLYTEAVPARLAYKYGAKLIQYFGYENECYFIDNIDKSDRINYHNEYHDIVEKNIRNNDRDVLCKESDKYLKKLVNCEEYINSTASVVYSGIKKSKEELKEELGIINEKKNVIILSHCFSDSPASTGTIYTDYYCALEETLKIVSKLNNVNWIVRPHPMRHSYGESGLVEKMYEKYKTDNLYWMSDEYSADMIPLLADAIITVSGTAGIEYSCFGIPCINTGTPFYSHYGFTLNPKSEEQYIKILSKVHKIKKLSQDKIKMAKTVMGAFSETYGAQKDEFCMLVKHSAEVFAKTQNVRECNNVYLQDVNEWLRENDIKDSYMYKWGNTLGEV